MVSITGNSPGLNTPLLSESSRQNSGKASIILEKSHGGTHRPWSWIIGTVCKCCGCTIHPLIDNCISKISSERGQYYCLPAQISSMTVRQLRVQIAHLAAVGRSQPGSPRRHSATAICWGLCPDSPQELACLCWMLCAVDLFGSVPGCRMGHPERHSLQY